MVSMQQSAQHSEKGSFRSQQTRTCGHKECISSAHCVQLDLISGAHKRILETTIRCHTDHLDMTSHLC